MKDDEELISNRKLRCFSLFLSHIVLTYKPTMWGIIFSIEGSQQKSLTFISHFIVLSIFKKKSIFQKKSIFKRLNIHALDLISLPVIK